MFWLFPMALGFAPVDSDLAPGPEAPHLSRNVALQIRWNSTPLVRDFQNRWGPWAIRWDQRNGSPRGLLGGGLPAEYAEQMLDDLARLAGVPREDLAWDFRKARGDRQVIHFRHSRDGTPIEGAGVDLFIQAGSIHLVLASLHRPNLDLEPRPGELILPLGRDGRIQYFVVTRSETDDTVTYRDRAGQLVNRYSKRHYLDVTTEERTVGDPLIQVPARLITVSNETATQITGDDGSHELEPPIDVQAQGPYLKLNDQGRLVEVDDVWDEVLDWDVDLSPAASSVLHHFYVVRDWLEATRPDHDWLPMQVTANVELSGTCNAYYSNGTINFYAEGGGCVDFGRIADVIYHEYGHGIHQYIMESGTYASDVSEGSSDFVAATILDDPYLSPGYAGPGTYIRELDTDKIYPDDITGEVHNDGQVWGSFLWNLRELWEEEYGAEAGWQMVDTLFLEALSYGPTMTDLGDAVLSADDDDGDITNGTPHVCELMSLLDHHGLAPSSLSMVTLDHEPISSAGSFDDSYIARWNLAELLPDCPELGLDESSPMLFYAVDPPTGATLDEMVFQGIFPDTDESGYLAAIPRQRAGSRVVYYLSWTLADDAETQYSHGGSADGLYSFFVGDRQELWCSDFEGGMEPWTTGPGYPGQPVDASWYSQWEVGEPQGQTYSPDSAWSGSQVLATALDGIGLYAKNNVQYVMTPDLDLSDANDYMLLLSFRRWLTVEDGQYDHATVWALQAEDQDPWMEPLWQNPASEEGDQHTLDMGWVQSDLDLRAFLQPGDSARLAWTLDSDSGLEYGGWHLDDVCLFTLADVPGHYRVRDLEATLYSTGVQLTWTQPFIEPLGETVLVRNDGGWPGGPDDGVVIARDLEPRWGFSVSAVDRDPPSGGIAYYAVFASAQQGQWYYDLVDGDNAVAVPISGGDSQSEPDTGSAAGETSTQGSPPSARSECGCSSTNNDLAGLWLLLPALLLSRRRRSSRE